MDIRSTAEGAACFEKVKGLDIIHTAGVYAHNIATGTKYGSKIKK